MGADIVNTITLLASHLGVKVTFRGAVAVLQKGVSIREQCAHMRSCVLIKSVFDDRCEPRFFGRAISVASRIVSRWRGIALQSLCLTFFPGLAFGYEPVNEELSYLYGDNDFVSIATGQKQRLAEAPAVASVITAEDIEVMGAQTLAEVLESVPGVHISLTRSNYNPVAVVRGIHAENNQQVLFLINGFPIKNAFIGDRGDVLKSQSVKNIARIEVIRGPGSAVYGADALAGVINIITKSAADIDGVEAGVALGSFDTKRAWFLYGDRAGEWDVAFGLDAMTTDGHSERIGEDQQTLFDTLMGTSASLAPEGVNLQRKEVDLFLDIEKSEWRIRAAYYGIYGDGTGAGLSGALDPEGEGEAERYTFDVTYHKPEIAEDWDLAASLSYYNLSLESDSFTLYPAGAFGGFPDGVKAAPSVSERHYNFDVTSFYTGFESHTVRLGAGYQYLDLYRVEDKSNFDLSAGFPPVDLGSVQPVPDAKLFNSESLREVFYLFSQDEWRFANDWALYTGVRYDHFSDFGSTLNPRLALVWNTGGLTTKLLYGRSFRAPSFAEQNNKNNPVNIGNANLDPEIINTYELAFDYAYSPDLRAGLNIFYYKMEDIIRFTPVAQNIGDQIGRGLEFEFEWEVSPLTGFKGNLGLQRAKDEMTGSTIANVPELQLYLQLDRQLLPEWNVSSRLNWVSGRQRDKGDAREGVADYTTLDLTLTGKELLPGFDVVLSVFNLTNENAKEPSAYDSLSRTVAIPGDLPLAGRSVVVTISKRW